MTKNKRLYSLFAKVEGRHVRLSAGALTLDSARRIWQGALLGGSCRGIAMNLRPVDGQVELGSDRAREIEAARCRLFC